MWPDLRVAWRRVAAAIIRPDKSVQWGKVAGPMAATIATLTQAGWDLSCVDSWIDPAGLRLQALTVPVGKVVAHVRRHAVPMVWQRAAQWGRKKHLMMGLLVHYID